MWNTLGGKYIFKMATPRDIEFPELYTTKVVNWIVRVDETTGNTKVAYEIIIWLQVWIGQLILALLSMQQPITLMDITLTVIVVTYSM